MGTEFSNDLVYAKYHKDAEIVKDGRRGPGIEVEFPNSVKLVVNRWRQGLAAKIEMCSQSGQDGQCGNFNGNHHDDMQEILMARVGKSLAEKDQLWAKAKYAIGDRVKVRDADTDDWKIGTVTAVSPELQVQPDYYDVAFAWEQIEHAADDA